MGKSLLVVAVLGVVVALEERHIAMQQSKKR